MKNVKEKEMHFKSIELNFIELIHLKEIIVRIVFFRSMYAVVYLMINVFINDVKIKTLFDNNVKINYMLKKLIDATQFLIRQEINIIMMNFIDKYVRFFDICELIFINIENIIILIFIFVIEHLNHDFLLIVFLTHCSYECNQYK